MISTKLLKALLVISVLLACILAATVFVRRSAHTTAAPFTQDIGKIDTLTLQVSTTTLVFTQNAGGWNIGSSSGTVFKADTDKVKVWLNGLKNLQVDDVISEQGSRASDFEINPESATVIMAYGKDHAVLGCGIFGKQADDYVHFYFRYPNQPAIYLAHGLVRRLLGEPQVDSWRDRTLLNVSEDQVITLLISGPDFKTALARSSDTWSLNGHIIDPPPVWGTLGVLAHLHADSFIDLSAHPEWAAGHLTDASITLQLKDGSTHVLHIGRKDALTKQYPISVDKDGDVFGVGEKTISGILRKPSEFKLKQ